MQIPVFDPNRRLIHMDFDTYNQMIDNAISELIDMKNELSHFQRGTEPPKCNPVIINPSTGRDCGLLSIDLRAGEDEGPIETAFFDWVEDFISRLPRRPETTSGGG
jgi:hypothetical protein